MAHNKNAASKWKVDHYENAVKAFTAAKLPAPGKRVEVIAGQAWDDETRRATDEVMKEMLHQFEPTRGEDVLDITPLGNKVWRDPERPTRNYWGFAEDGLVAMRAIREADKTAVDCGDMQGVQQQVKRARTSGYHPSQAQTPSISQYCSQTVTHSGDRSQQGRQELHRGRPDYRPDYHRVPPPSILR